LDEALFGADPPEPLPEGEVSGPIATKDGIYFVKSLSDVEVREVDEQWADTSSVQAEETEHMEISWIQLPSESTDVEAIAERLQSEEFDDVASEIGGGSGPQGWVPLGAYTGLDEAIFGPQPLKVGEVSAPITGENATFILTATAGPEVMEIDAGWLTGLKNQALQEWIDQQWALGRQEGWVEVHTDSEKYKWVVEQYAKSVREEQEAQPEGN
jgi:hypothetical protein